MNRRKSYIILTALLVISSLLAGAGVAFHGSGIFSPAMEMFHQSHRYTAENLSVIPAGENGEERDNSYEVKMVSAGRQHTLVLLEKGDVFSFGRNSHGRLGLGDFQNRDAPEIISGFRSVTAISAGADHSLIIQNGEVYAFGYNRWGQLGNGEYGNSIVPVKTLDIPGEAVAVSAGGNHSLVLTGEGEVYSFGRNNYNQLGRKAGVSYIKTPGKVEGMLGEAAAISAGKDHSLVMMKDGRVYSFGLNNIGQLGLGDNRSRTEPKMVALDGNDNINAKAISAAPAGGVTDGEHSLILNRDGEVYSFGRGTYGRLGHGDTLRQYSPTLIEGLSDIKSITAGGEYSLAVSNDGTVYSFGWNDFGQLGLGDDISRYTPVEVTGMSETARSVTAGGNHTLVITQGGELYSFGLNNYGQLGHGNQISLDIPKLIVVDPIINLDVADIEVVAGNTAEFRMDVIGFEPLNFRWEKSSDGEGGWETVEESGGITHTVIPTPTIVAEESGVYYRCVIFYGSEQNGDVTFKRSRAGKLTLLAATPAAEHSEVSQPGEQTAGESFNIDLILRDEYGNIAEDGRYDVEVLSDREEEIVFDDEIFCFNGTGEATLNLTLTDAGGGGDHELTIKVDGNIITDSLKVNVVPGPIDGGESDVYFSDGESHALGVAGEPIQLSILLRDAYGNLIDDSYPVRVDSNIEGMVANVPGVIFSDGGGTVSVELEKALEQEITVYVDGEEIYPKDDKLTVDVSPGPVDTVSTEPAPSVTVTAGEGRSFSARAEDRFGNLITDDAGDFTWEKTFEGETAEFDDGLFYEERAGDHTVAAIYDGTSGPLAVKVEPADPHEVVIDEDAGVTATAGVNFTFLAEALDIYGNRITANPANFQWDGALNGVFYEEIAGVYYVRADYGDLSSPVITVTVVPGPPHAIKTVPESLVIITAGESLTFSARLEDEFGNLITDDAGDFTWENTFEGETTDFADGLFNEKRAGEHTVTASYDNHIFEAVDVKVNPGPFYAGNSNVEPPGGQTTEDPFYLNIGVFDEFENALTDEGPYVVSVWSDLDDWFVTFNDDEEFVNSSDVTLTEAGLLQATLRLDKVGAHPLTVKVNDEKIVEDYLLVDVFLEQTKLTIDIEFEDAFPNDERAGDYFYGKVDIDVRAEVLVEGVDQAENVSVDLTVEGRGGEVIFTDIIVIGDMAHEATKKASFTLNTIIELADTYDVRVAANADNAVRETADYSFTVKAGPPDGSKSSVDAYENQTSGDPFELVINLRDEFDNPVEDGDYTVKVESSEDGLKNQKDIEFIGGEGTVRVRLEKDGVPPEEYVVHTLTVKVDHNVDVEITIDADNVPQITVYPRQAELSIITDLKEVFPDNRIGWDYGVLSLEVKETDGADAKDVTVELLIEKETPEGNEDFLRLTKNGGDIPALGSPSFSFDVGAIDEAAKYTVTVTANARNAFKVTKSHLFYVEKGVDPDNSGVTVPPGEYTAGDEFDLAVELRNEYDRPVVDGDYYVRVFSANSSAFVTVNDEGNFINEIKVYFTDGEADISVRLKVAGDDELTVRADGVEVVERAAVSVAPHSLHQVEISPRPFQEVEAGADVFFAAEAMDKFGNTITDDIGAFTWHGAENGVFRKVVAGEYEVWAGYEGVTSQKTIIDVVPAPVNKVIISPEPPADKRAGEELYFSARAEDEFGNLVSDNEDDFSWELLLNGEPRVFDGGVYKLEKAGEYRFIASYNNDPSISSQITFTVIPGDIDGSKSSVTAPESVTAGDVFNIEVTLRDAYGNPVEDKDYQVTVDAIGPEKTERNAEVREDSMYSFEGGAGQVDIRLKNAGENTLKVTIGKMAVIQEGDKPLVKVNHGPISALKSFVERPDTQGAGDAFELTVNLRDEFDNPIPGDYAVTVESDLEDADVNETISFSEEGTGKVSVTLNTMGNHTLSVYLHPEGEEKIAVTKELKFLVMHGLPFGDNCEVAKSSEDEVPVAGRFFELTLKLRDRFGNAVQGVYPVDVLSGRGADIEILVESEDDGNGVEAAEANVSFNKDGIGRVKIMTKVAGEDNLTVSVAGVEITEKLTVNVLSGPFYPPNSGVDDPGGMQTTGDVFELVIRLRDEFGNHVNDAYYDVAVFSGSETIKESNIAFREGVGSIGVVFLKHGVYTLAVEVNGSELSDEYEVNVQPPEIFLGLDDFKASLPHAEAGFDYGELAITVRNKTEAREAENVTASLKIEGIKTGELFEAEKNIGVISGGVSATAVFEVGEINRADTYMVTVTANAHRAVAVMKSHEFVVEPGQLDAGESFVKDPGSQSAGFPFDLRMELRDRFGNVVADEDYLVTVSSDIEGDLIVSEPVSSRGGSCSAGLTIETIGDHKLRVTVEGEVIAEGMPVTVNPVEAELELGDFAGHFSDGAAGDNYGWLSIEVIEALNGEHKAENVTITMHIEGRSSGEVIVDEVTEKLGDLEPGGIGKADFSIGVITKADTFDVKVTANGDNAFSVTKSHTFTVIPGALDAGKSRAEAGLDQEMGIAFDLIIYLKDFHNNPLPDGGYLVSISSDMEEGFFQTKEIDFKDGRASVGVVLENLGIHTLTVEVNDILISGDGLQLAVSAGNRSVRSVTLDEELNLFFIGEKTVLVPYIEPRNALDKRVQWSSADNTVASVDRNGMVTAVGVGETVITVTTMDGGYRAQCIVKVHDSSGEFRMLFSDPYDGEREVPVNRIIRLVFNREVRLANGGSGINIVGINESLEFTAETKGNVLYLIPHEDRLAYDEKYEVRVRRNALTDVDGNFPSKDIEPIVFWTAEYPVYPIDVGLNTYDITLFARGGTAVLVPLIEPSDATEWSVVWRSDNPHVAGVDKDRNNNGIITALSFGNATVTAEVSDGNGNLKTVECNVQVFRYGDVDLDGSITVSDAILVLRKVVGLAELTPLQIEAGRVSGNPELSVSDAIFILRYVVGIIDGFPVESLSDDDSGDDDDVPHYGDVDGDGNVTVSDAIMVLRQVVGLLNLSDSQLKAALVSGNDNLTVSDAILILRYVVGLISKFPADTIP